MSIVNGIEKPGACVVKFSETAIMNEAKIAQIGAEFEQLVTRTAQKRLLVNFSGVTHMSSAMIGQLVMLNRRCKSAEVALKFCEIGPSVMEVFKIMRLHKLFSIYKDEESAIKAFSKKGWFG